MNAFDVFRRQRKFALQGAVLDTSIARYETVLLLCRSNTSGGLDLTR